MEWERGSGVLGTSGRGSGVGAEGPEEGLAAARWDLADRAVEELFREEDGLLLVLRGRRTMTSSIWERLDLGFLGLVQPPRCLG